MNTCAEDYEPANLLCLDGGGVRGVSSLVILDEIMMKIQEIYNLPETPKPCEFFHLIAGTSTGGLIAIMLGRLRMSTKEALQAYDSCAARIFSFQNRKLWSLSQRFRATALQKVVEEIARERGLGENMWEEQVPEKGKVMVCVMPADDIGQPLFVRSYPREYGTHEQWDDQITIWQAARATTAASSFFKPQMLGTGQKARAYIDAAIGVNNPINFLLDEAVDELGSGRRLGCIVSVGTGTRTLQVPSKRTLFQGGIVYYKQLLRAAVKMATDGESAHWELSRRLSPFPGSYYRFSVTGAAEKIELHHYKELPTLKTLTAEYLAKEDIPEQIERLSRALKTGDFGHGLTLGHVFSLDKDQVVLSNKKPRSMWPTNRFFTGRSDILMRLDSFFSRRDTGCKPRREFLLYGMAGIGKTEIAMRVAENLGDRFSHVFFIDGSTPATILQSYVKIATKQGLARDQDNLSPESLRSEAVMWISRLTEEWLMIFDDCNLSDREFHLPARDKGSIIYTSRSMALSYGLPPECVLEVTPLQEAEAIELLLKVSGIGNDVTNAQDMASAREIVQELGCSPLAVDKAAMSIRHGRTSLPDYLGKLREQKVRTISDPRFQDKDIENLAAFSALELAYEAILSFKRREGRRNMGRAAVLGFKLLSLLCFFHHTDIPLSMIARAAKERRAVNGDNAYPFSELMDPVDLDWDMMFRLREDGEWDPAWVSVGLDFLHSFSLVKVSRDKRSVSMHVLVHDWAQHRMDRETYLRQSLLAKIVAIESIPVLGTSMAERMLALRVSPHLDACRWRESKALNHDSYEMHLWYKFGWYFQLMKDWERGEEYLLRCLHFYKQTIGNQSYDVLNTLQCLAVLYQSAGFLDKAEMAYLEVIELLREKESQLLDDIYGTSKPTEKEGGHLRSLSRVRRRTLRDLAENPLRQFSGRMPGRLVKVESKPKPGESSDSEKPPPVRDKPREEILDDLLRVQDEIAQAHSSLSDIYMEQGRYGAGKRILLKSQQYFDGAMRDGEPNRLALMIKAKSLTDPGNLEFWEPLVRKVMDTIEPTGYVSGSFAASDRFPRLLLYYAICLLKNNKPRSAWRLFVGAIKEHMTDVFGSHDQRVLETLRYMATCRYMWGDHESHAIAVKIAEDCLRRARVAYKEFHRETVLALQKKYEAIYFQRLEYNEECEALLKEALYRAERCLGSAHPITQGIRATLDVHQRKKDETPKGQSILQVPASSSTGTPMTEHVWQASKANLEKLKAAFGPDHFSVVRFSRLVGDGPPKTREELVDRLLGSVGPHHSATKALMARLEMERASQRATDGIDCVRMEGRTPHVGGDAARPCGEAAAQSGGHGNSHEASATIELKRRQFIPRSEDWQPLSSRLLTGSG
ncbi:hypothetical protein VTK26DRAFT_6943 [Humicola hyalothermophila]